MCLHMHVVQDLVGRYAANTGAGTAPQGWSAPPVINPLVDVGQGAKVRRIWDKQCEEEGRSAPPVINAWGL